MNRESQGDAPNLSRTVTWNLLAADSWRSSIAWKRESSDRSSVLGGLTPTESSDENPLNGIAHSTVLLKDQGIRTVEQGTVR